MSAAEIGFIETAEPVHTYAKREIAPLVDEQWSYLGSFAELFESDRKLGERMTQETRLTMKAAETLQANFSFIEIYCYKMYLEMLLREQKTYSERLRWWATYAVVPFVAGLVFLPDQRAAILLAALLTVIPAFHFFSYRIEKLKNFTRTLKLACEFVEINEKHSGK